MAKQGIGITRFIVLQDHIDGGLFERLQGHTWGDVLEGYLVGFNS